MADQYLLDNERSEDERADTEEEEKASGGKGVRRKRRQEEKASGGKGVRRKRRQEEKASGGNELGIANFTGELSTPQLTNG